MAIPQKAELSVTHQPLPPLARRRVPFLDLSVYESAERSELLAAIERVFAHGRIIDGPEVTELEERLAAACGVRYAVGVGSGTDALFLALRLLGIGPGDEVITTPLSFVATTNAIVLAGAEPVFVDIDEDLNLSPEAIEAAITPRTRAIVPVHFTGLMCPMDRIGAIAKAHGLRLIEDASQAFGAKWQDRAAGSIGDCGAISLNSMKLLGACGEAGVVLVSDQESAERLACLRYNGMVDKANCHWPSGNARLDTVQAAVLLTRLGRLPALLARRAEIASRYDQVLSRYLEIPSRTPNCDRVYYTYTIQTDSREPLKAFLESQGIEVKVQHRPLIPEHEAFRGRFRSECPNAERIVERILCLPCHEKMTDEQIELVIASVQEFFG